MSGILKNFANALQSSHLKAHGFQKRYETFSRQHAAYSEHYHLQPASWNRDGEKWSFHLILGIGFTGIPSKQKGQLAGCHASKRHTTVDTILINPKENDPEKIQKEVARVAEIILGCSEYLKKRHQVLRHSYDRGILDDGFPADPEQDTAEH